MLKLVHQNFSMSLEPLTTVNKESVAESTFHQPLRAKKAKNLDQKIADALLLGNGYHTKVSIRFQDDQGVKEMRTTIWASGSKFICLKGGLWLPISHIIDIQLI